MSNFISSADAEPDGFTYARLSQRSVMALIHGFRDLWIAETSSSSIGVGPVRSLALAHKHTAQPLGAPTVEVKGTSECL